MYVCIYIYIYIEREREIQREREREICIDVDNTNGYNRIDVTRAGCLGRPGAWPHEAEGPLVNMFSFFLFFLGGVKGKQRNPENPVCSEAWAWYTHLNP